MKIHNCFNLLGLVGHKFEEKEIIDACLEGLASEFEVFITSFNMKSESTLVNELVSLLFTHEALIEKQNLENEVSTNVAMSNISISNSQERRPYNKNSSQ